MLFAHFSRQTSFLLLLTQPGGQYGGSSGGGNRDQIVVPRGLVGLIIGTGGSTIKGLQQRTGAKIQLLPDNGAPERVVSIEGSSEAVDSARKEIEDMMEDNRHRVGGQPQRVEMVRIPCVATKVGLVIGKGIDSSIPFSRCRLRSNRCPKPLQIEMTMSQVARRLNSCNPKSAVNYIWTAKLRQGQTSFSSSKAVPNKLSVLGSASGS